MGSARGSRCNGRRRCRNAPLSGRRSLLPRRSRRDGLGRIGGVFGRARRPRRGGLSGSPLASRFRLRGRRNRRRRRITGAGFRGCSGLVRSAFSRDPFIASSGIETRRRICRRCRRGRDGLVRSRRRNFFHARWRADPVVEDNHDTGDQHQHQERCACPPDRRRSRAKDPSRPRRRGAGWRRKGRLGQRHEPGGHSSRIGFDRAQERRGRSQVCAARRIVPEACQNVRPFGLAQCAVEIGREERRIVVTSFVRLCRAFESFTQGRGKPGAHGTRTVRPVRAIAGLGKKTLNLLAQTSFHDPGRHSQVETDGRGFFRADRAFP
jgi:hypothetical protein